jgi:chromate transporter
MVHHPATAPAPEPAALREPASFREALAVWTKIGCLSFGGPAAQIALIHRLVVDEKKWVDEPTFLTALNFCMLLPGPEAQQLATYVGWLKHGTKGGLAAGLLFVLPGALVMLALSVLAAYGAGTLWVDGLFLGIKAAVLAIVVEALIRIGKRALKTTLLRVLASAAFLAILLFEAPFPLIVLAAALFGYVVARGRPDLLAIAPPPPGPVPPPRPDRLTTALTSVVTWGTVWWAPVALAALTLGAGHIVVELGLFFGKLAMLTFGGAYALLAWLAQAAVEDKGWLTAAEMVTGLGLAETTPGPLILVTQHVGFLAAFRDPGTLTPLTAGLIGAAITTWVTFAPSFLWIFTGAPFIEDLRRNRALSGALAAITAVVAGVILYVAVWFALHVLFGTVGETQAGLLRLFTVDPASINLRALGIGLVAALLLFRLHAGVIVTVLVCAALGVVSTLV